MNENSTVSDSSGASIRPERERERESEKICFLGFVHVRARGETDSLPGGQNTWTPFSLDGMGG